MSVLKDNENLVAFESVLLAFAVSSCMARTSRVLKVDGRSRRVWVAAVDGDRRPDLGAQVLRPETRYRRPHLQEGRVFARAVRRH